MSQQVRQKRRLRYAKKIARDRVKTGQKSLAGPKLLDAARKAATKASLTAHKSGKRAKVAKERSAKSLESKKKQVVRQAESAYKRGQSEQRQKNWQTTAKWGQAAYASHMLGYAARRTMVEPASKLSRAGDINFTGKK